MSYYRGDFEDLTNPNPDAIIISGAATDPTTGLPATVESENAAYAAAQARGSFWDFVPALGQSLGQMALFFAPIAPFVGPAAAASLATTVPAAAIKAVDAAKKAIDTERQVASATEEVLRATTVATTTAPVATTTAPVATGSVLSGAPPVPSGTYFPIAGPQQAPVAWASALPVSRAQALRRSRVRPGSRRLSRTQRKTLLQEALRLALQ